MTKSVSYCRRCCCLFGECFTFLQQGILHKHNFSLDFSLCSSFVSSRYPFPTVFSTCSKKDLAASLEKGVGMCLYNMPEVKVLYGGQKCGNGYVEEGEECDCGEPEVNTKAEAFIFAFLSGCNSK